MISWVPWVGWEVEAFGVLSAGGWVVTLFVLLVFGMSDLKLELESPSLTTFGVLLSSLVGGT
jgi:hypothetical protein